MKLSIPVRYGLLAGAVTVVYFLIFYFIDRRTMVSAGVHWGSLGIFIVLMWRAVQQQKAVAEHFPFREALRTGFIVYIFGAVSYYLFYYFLYGLIDPELVAIQREMMLETTRTMGAWMGAGDIEAELRKLSEADLTVRPGGLLLSLGRSLIGGFLISLIIAAITRR